MSDPALPFERPLGARPTGDAATEFRVWAPRPQRVALRAGGREHELADAGYGVYEAELPVAPGEDYVYVLDGHEVPDPCSRWQPAGLRGPSRVELKLVRRNELIRHFATALPFLFTCTRRVPNGGLN